MEYIKVRIEYIKVQKDSRNEGQKDELVEVEGPQRLQSQNSSPLVLLSTSLCFLFRDILAIPLTQLDL